MVLLVWCCISIGIIPRFVSCQPLESDLAHSPLSAPVSDDIIEAHADVSDDIFEAHANEQHLKWVHELQL